MAGEVALKGVLDARTAADGAAARLRMAVSDAHSQGASVAELARTAAVTRQTIYRWIKDAEARL